MPPRKTVLLVLLWVGWSGLLSLQSAKASDGAHYLLLRARAHYNPALSPKQVEADPAHYEGYALEVQGKVMGWAGGGNNVTVLLLPTNDVNDPLSLNVPANEKTFFSELQDMGGAATIRVLLRVEALEAGSNIPKYRVLAAALEDDVEAALTDAKTQAEAQKLQKMWDKAQWLQAFRRSLPPDLRGSMPARGGEVRAPLAVEGDASVQTAVYTAAMPPELRPMFLPYFQYIASRNPSLSDRDVGLITYCLLTDSYQLQVDPRLTVSMIIAESDFDPKCTSNKGAMGLCQLMPDEVQRYGLTNGYDIAQNIWGGVMELRECLNRYQAYAAPDGSLSDEQIRLAMAAYNAGPGAVKKYAGVPPYKETQDYVRKVLRYFHQLCGTGSTP